MLALAFLHEEQETGGDTGAAGKTAKHVKPAQQPMAEMLQMQTGEELIDPFHRRWRRVLAQHFTGGGVEVNAFPGEGNAVGTGAVNAHVTIGVTNVLQRQKAHITGHVPGRPAALGLRHHRVHRSDWRGDAGPFVG